MSGKEQKYIRLLKKAGVSSVTVKAIRAIDKMKFFDPIFSDRLYAPEGVPIGAGQKSDDPFALARMIDLLALKRDARVLEIGTGSGYSTAVIARLAGEVVTVEFQEELALRAKETLAQEGITAVKFFQGDATDFNGPLGEFDAVVIFAGCARTPYSVINLTRPGGVAVFPMGPAYQQQIARYVNNIAEPDVTNNFKFYDLFSFDSIRGMYGWVDLPAVPSAEDPAEKPAPGDEDAPGAK